MFLLTRETSCEGLTLILTFVFSKTEFITVICGETVIHTAEQNRASQHRRHFLTSAPFLLDLLHFSDVLFFFLLDFKDVCRQEDKHISTSDFVCVCVCVCVCTCVLRTLMIQVGGMMTAAWAPSEQHSSICCSMKHVTLLWYWNTNRKWPHKERQRVGLTLCYCVVDTEIKKQTFYSKFCCRSRRENRIMLLWQQKSKGMKKLKENKVYMYCKTINDTYRKK